jgi:uncharacterized iron-regulated membrane protein
MKVFWRNIHLYLGLATGLVILVVCFTGAVLVFEKEFQQTLYPERYFVAAQTTRLSLDSIVQKFEASVTNAKVSGVKLYADPQRSLEVSYVEKKRNKSEGGDQKKSEGKASKAKDTKKKPEAPRAKQAFVNPYSGELISLYDSRSGFFFTMFSLHRWLLMGDAGKIITGTSTLIFLFILITGIILWWPKTKAKLKQHLTLKWAGWKRINHDLHIVIGFYTAIFLFAFAFTGLAWSFEWFNNGIYWVTGTESKRPEPPASVYLPAVKPVSTESILDNIQTYVPDASYTQLNLPKDSAAVYAVTVMTGSAAHERASDQYFFDQYTGQLAGTALYNERNVGQRIRSTFYPIHVGSIGGLPGRIIAFMACIAGTTFPITGVILWLNRLKTRNQKFSLKFNTITFYCIRIGLPSILHNPMPGNN